MLTSLSQYAFVNGRPVQDKQILSAIRAAYSDTLPRGRYPVAVLWITLDPALVDVNVHPAKADVRFRDPGLVRGLIIGAIRQALTDGGDRASPSASLGLAQAFRSAPAFGDTPQPGFGHHGSFGQSPAPGRNGWQTAQSPSRPLDGFASGFSEQSQPEIGGAATPSARVEEMQSDPSLETHPLGAARTQIHENYIVAQTRDGLVIVDQHAAHERLVFERLKSALRAGRVPSQILLLPEIIDIAGKRIVTDLASGPMIWQSSVWCSSASGRAPSAVQGNVLDAGRHGRGGSGPRVLPDEIADWDSAGGPAATGLRPWP